MRKRQTALSKENEKKEEGRKRDREHPSMKDTQPKTRRKRPKSSPKEEEIE